MGLRESSLGRRYYAWLDTLLLPGLTRLGISPQALSWTGMGVALAVPLGFALHPLAGLGLMLASGLFDSLDGLLARRTGRATPAGALLDSTLDRVSDTAYLLGFWVLFLGRADLAPASAVFLMAATTTPLISYVKARALTLAPDAHCAQGPMSREVRVIFLLFWALALGVLGASGTLLWVGLCVYTLLTLVTALRRLRAFDR